MEVKILPRRRVLKLPDNGLSSCAKKTQMSDTNETTHALSEYTDWSLLTGLKEIKIKRLLWLNRHILIKECGTVKLCSNAVEGTNHFCLWLLANIQSKGKLYGHQTHWSEASITLWSFRAKFYCIAVGIKEVQQADSSRCEDMSEVECPEAISGDEKGR